MRRADQGGAFLRGLFAVLGPLLVIGILGSVAWAAVRVPPEYFEGVGGQVNSRDTFTGRFTGFTATSTPAFTQNTSAKHCFNGPACTVYLASDGGVLYTDSALFVQSLKVDGGIEIPSDKSLYLNAAHTGSIQWDSSHSEVTVTGNLGTANLCLNAACTTHVQDSSGSLSLASSTGVAVNSTLTSSVASGSNGYAQGTGTRIDVGAGSLDYLSSNGTSISTPGLMGVDGATAPIAGFQAGALTSASGNLPTSTTSGLVVVKPYSGDPNNAMALALIQDSAIGADTGGGISFGSRCDTSTIGTVAAIQGLKENSSSNDFSGYLRFTTRAGAGNNTERMRIPSVGGVMISSQALSTCAAAIEGVIQRDVAGGVATGHRTRLCVCTSDGSSVYKWQNTVSGTLGTTTTCAD